jgi:hypothetical protein
MSRPIKVGDIVRVGGTADAELRHWNAGRFRTVLFIHRAGSFVNNGFAFGITRVDAALLDGDMTCRNTKGLPFKWPMFPLSGLVPLDPPSEDKAINTETLIEVIA